MSGPADLRDGAVRPRVQRDAVAGLQKIAHQLGIPVVDMMIANAASLADEETSALIVKFLDAVYDSPYCILWLQNLRKVLIGDVRLKQGQLAVLHLSGAVHEVRHH